MKNISEMFGSMVFNDTVMKERLPKDTYKALKKTISQGSHLEIDVANVVANAMKDWSVEKGATHFTHWFQPMTGVTAEKHDSFITPEGEDKVIMEFAGKELVKGEPDASSFPSGGLRATFEARGYTAWDPTSYAFIKDGTLCIPTAFCSYSGESLDKKTPLLKSMEVVNEQALRILKLFGNTTTKRVISTVGCEQEYFLIDKDVYSKRPDLINCGRTLLGAKATKGQEMDDHYFGIIKPRVSAFMKELDEELWKLGIYSKTKHNEVAPAQHEMAPVFETANVATDHNQLTMELMKSVANRHNLVCLLHEKPFEGINGSGKHNNWSISTDDGINLLEPGETPSQNARFILFLAAIIKAVDKYQDLLRLSVASAGNDHRLGANEAPPAIISIFLGDELTEILEAIEAGEKYKDKLKSQMEIGATVLPHFPQDATDRNRTSPFAFTGNKFEFRMLGSSLSVSGPNFTLNTIVADVLEEMAIKLESAKDFKKELKTVIQETIASHKRIIFNGNNYSDEWVKEAEERGLSNYKTTVDVLPAFVAKENVDVFVKYGVLSESEVKSRYEILLENYNKIIHIETVTIADMVKKYVIPASITYQKELLELIELKKINSEYKKSVESTLVEKISDCSDLLIHNLCKLEEEINQATGIEDALMQAKHYEEKVLCSMNELRMNSDCLEEIIAKKYWELPSYSEILNSVY